MALTFAELTEEQARQIGGWKYPGDFASYNCPPWDEMLSKRWGLTDALTRKIEFKSVCLNDVFIGFFRLQLRAGKLYLGLGLAPDYCGRGLGSKLIELIKDYAKKNFPQKELYLEVRTFNARAIKCYRKAGFRTENNYVQDSHEFITMRCEL